jgi:uncharacterized membrane protein YfcA
LTLPPPEHLALLVLGGAIAGFVNTLAGGGSFLTVPLLVLLGLPPTVANGTNRLAVFVQNVAAVVGFRAEGVSGVRSASRLLPPVLLGAWLGAYVASEVPEELFARAFGVFMLLGLPIVLRRPRPLLGGAGSPVSKPLQLLLYFVLGLYGGAIQAGIGIPLLLALVAVGGLDLVRANSVKVVIIAALTAVALAQFVVAGKVVPGYGLVLAVGSGLGGYGAGRLGARVGDRLIRPLLVIAVVALALRMLFGS